MTPNLTKLLDEMEQARAAFDERIVAYGPSEMHAGCFYAGTVVGPDPHPNFMISKSGEFFDQNQAAFHVIAANKIDQLIRICRIQHDALKIFENEPTYSLGISYPANEAMKECEAIAGERL